MSMTIKEMDDSYVANTYKRFPVEIVSGKGSIVKDSAGKEYIDLGAGIAVSSFGIADDAWIAAVTEQINKLQHMSNLYYTEPCAVLAKMLCEKTGMKKVFFGNSGAEANECAIKVARKYAQDKKGQEYYTIATLKNSFHGRTLTTLAATGQDAFHKLFTPLTPGFVHMEPNNYEELEKTVKENKLAGILIEIVQGEGGVVPVDKEYVQAIEKICREQDIVFMVDEVQTGNGRSGSLYAYMNYGVQPDVVSTAKGLAGGLPLGACLMGEKVEHTLGYGDHGSTFGGNPVSTAAAVSVLSRIDDELLADVRKKSDYIFKTLNGCKGIEAVTGMGLMIGIKTVKPAGEIIAKCIEKGALPIAAHDRVRLVPALNIPMELVAKACCIIKEVCAED